MNKITDQQMAQAEKQMKVWESIIHSMTPQERSTPELLATVPSRRRRIARGSGRNDVDVNKMLASFTAMRSRMRDMSKMMAMSGGQGEQRQHCSTDQGHKLLAANGSSLLRCAVS